MRRCEGDADYIGESGGWARGGGGTEGLAEGRRHSTHMNFTYLR